MGIGVKANLMQKGWKFFDIMHKDRKVARIYEDGRCTIYYPSFMPYNLCFEKSNDFDSRVNNLNNFYYWCSSRVLTLDRKYAKEILRVIGANQAVTDKDRAKIEKLGETGKWFRDNFKESPPTSMVAIEDWKNKGNQTAWYYNKNYRINFMTSKDKAWIRDIQLFYENYIDPHYVVPTAEETVKYDALPIIDGYLWSGNGKRSGIYLIDSDSGEYLKCRINNTRKVNDDLVLEAQINEKPVEIVFSDRTIEIVGYDMEFSWMWSAPEIENTEAWLEEDSRLLLKHNYYIYGLEGESITKGEEENTYIIKGNKLNFFFGS